MKRTKVANFKVDPDAFAQYFRTETFGRVYDPSFGRLPGRVVSLIQENDAKRRYAALYEWLAGFVARWSLLFWTVALAAFVGAVLKVVPPLTLAFAFLSLVALPFMQNGYANRRLRNLREEFWGSLEFSEVAPQLTKSDQIARGYRLSRKEAAIALFFLALGLAYKISDLLAKAGWDQQISASLGVQLNGRTVALGILAFLAGVVVVEFVRRRARPSVKGLPAGDRHRKRLGASDREKP